MTDINEQVVEAINMDDAYSGGTRDGKIFFARKLKRMMED